MHVKDFVKFAIHFVQKMESEREKSPFLEIAKESQTRYIVHADMKTFMFDAFLPSYVCVL